MGTYDDFARPEQACTSAIRTLTQPEGDRLCPMGEAVPVSQGRQPGPRITDEQREAAIARAGLLVEYHMADLRAINNRDPHIFSDFADAASARWKAQRAREMMEQLIAGRSAEYVAKLEEQRGLR